MNGLSEIQIERYSRQLLLGGWGSAEQHRLLQSSVGVSSTAEIALRYLVGAGVGRISILGEALSLSVAEELHLLNPDVTITGPGGTLDAAIVVNKHDESEAGALLAPAAECLVIESDRVRGGAADQELPVLVRGNPIYPEALCAGLVLQKLVSTGAPTRK